MACESTKTYMNHSNDHSESKNLDAATIASFGDEWSRFDQSALSAKEAQQIFDEYFAIFPWHQLPSGATGFDMGCGSGRWAKIMARKVGHLHCIDPSSALAVAKKALREAENVTFHQASVDDTALPVCSQDFGYSLGVLHHIPDTGAAVRACVSLLKPGAPFLVYLYYAFDNRSVLFKAIWKISDLMRRIICRMPNTVKHIITDAIALLVYWPMSGLSLLLKKIGLNPHGMPLSYYRNHSFYTLRTDSRDRFGTPLEQRFTRREIQVMLETAGLQDVRFSDRAPYWCAVGVKR